MWFYVFQTIIISNVTFGIRKSIRLVHLVKTIKNKSISSLALVNTVFKTI